MRRRMPRRGRAPTARFWSPTRPVGRLALSILVGTVVSQLLPGDPGAPVRTVAGWNAGAWIYLYFTWRIILRAGPDETERLAGIEDVGKKLVWGIVLLASTVSVFAATVAFRNAKALAPNATVPLAVLCLLAVVSAWVLCHTAYTTRYAHLYYGNDPPNRGLSFPGTEQPCELDFAYYAFNIGMCFQVSDVAVTLHSMRVLTMVHAMLSFAFNTAILALSLNLLLGQLA
jgi:uncharacterized membrane protein